MVKTSKNDARQIRDYMKENIHGEINTNKLVQRLEKDDVMSHGKAYPAIRLAVDLGLIKEQIKYRGKIEMKYLTTDEKYEEEENSRLDKMEKLLKQFDENFENATLLNRKFDEIFEKFSLNQEEIRHFSGGKKSNLFFGRKNGIIIGIFFRFQTLRI